MVKYPRKGVCTATVHGNFISNMFFFVYQPVYLLAFCDFEDSLCLGRPRDAVQSLLWKCNCPLFNRIEAYRRYRGATRTLSEETVISRHRPWRMSLRVAVSNSWVTFWVTSLYTDSNSSTMI